MDEPLRTAMLCGIYAGFRVRREALTLRWEDVDLERNTLTVEAGYSKTHKRRTVPLHPVLRDALKALRDKARPEAEWVFEKLDGTRYKDFRLERFSKKSGVNTTPHAAGRHTFASRVGDGGASTIALQELGGWIRPEMAQRYSHLSDEYKQKLIADIPSPGRINAVFPAGIKTVQKKSSAK